MYKLELKNFKAHKNLEVEFNNKNFLLYGDNGAGKSSIYEALKVIFFDDEIKLQITKELRKEEYEEFIRTFWAEYNNTNNNEEFNLKLYSNSNSELVKDNYKLFMFDIDDLYFDKYLNLKDLLSKVYFNINFDNSNDKIYKLEDKVNTLLETFMENNIKIKIDIEDSYNIRLEDNTKNITSTKDIRRFFNEAKINLVVLSILFIIIEEYKSDESNINNILVLDDFITSLDVSNRTFIMKYIFDTFNDNFQIVLLTHNIYFYNLIMYLINEIYKSKEKWQFANLFEIGSNNKIYTNLSNKKKLELNDLYLRIENNESLESIGNDIRQKFEILLYELSKVLLVGGVEESKNIIDNIINTNNFYLYKDGNKLKDSLYLIEEIVKVIQSSGTIETIKNILEKYKIDNLNEIKTILKDLKLYQKVHMHPLSHGQIIGSSFNIEEAKTSMLLLEKLENNIFSLMHKKTDGA
jgi:energy-coupling factor transporter ATP-binding protein EcfA2